MNKNILISNEILQDEKLKNLDINLYMCLYRYKDNYHKTRLLLKDIGEILAVRNADKRLSCNIQNISNYVKVEKEKCKNSRRNVFRTEKPVKDFTTISFQVYDRYCTKADVIVNYTKLKRIAFILKDKPEADILDYISLGNWSNDEFIKILTELQKENLIKSSFSIQFLQENLTMDEDEVETINIQIPTPAQADNTDIEYYLNYFYSKSGLAPVNEQQEKKNLKSLVSKLTKEEIEFILDYANQNNVNSLLKINNIVNDALKVKKLRKEGELKGTASYLVSKYYQYLKVFVSDTLLQSQSQKVQNIINIYGYEKTEIVVKQMAKANITLNFIETEAPKVLITVKQVQANRDNPCMYDRSDMVYIKSDLRSARCKLDNVETKFKEDAKKIAKEMFMNGDFSDKFGLMEWAWKIGLEIEEDMYEMGKYQIEAIGIERRIRRNANNKTLIETLNKEKTEFKDWLNDLVKRYKY